MRFRFLLFSSIASLGVFLLPHAANAAILFMSPQHANVHPDGTLSVAMALDSQGESVNVVSARMVYPTELLEAVSTHIGGSFISLWAEEPTIDRSTGSISLAGGVPNGSVVYNGTVATVLFKVKKVGTAQIVLDENQSSVYLNDGFGTKAKLTTQPIALQSTRADPLAPSILSSTHPDEARWYAQRDVVFSWKRYDQAFYTFTLSRDPEKTPDAIPDETDGMVRYQTLSDGVWYFTLQERLAGDVFGSVAQHRVMIDAVPPQPFTVDRITDPATHKQLLSFHALDATSGVTSYRIRLLEPRFAWFPFFLDGTWRTAANPVLLNERELVGSATVQAVDAAGNIRTATWTNPNLATAQRRFLLYCTGILGALIFLFEGCMLYRKHRRLRRL